jgi:hypothetical protein
MIPTSDASGCASDLSFHRAHDRAEARLLRSPAAALPQTESLHSNARTGIRCASPVFVSGDAG